MRYDIIVWGAHSKLYLFSFEVISVINNFYNDKHIQRL